MELGQALGKNVGGATGSSVFFERKFLLLWFTLLASGFSVSFFMFITNWYVVDYLKLEAMLGLVFFASSVPRLVFMLIGGAIADRISKTLVMFISDVTKGILLLVVIGLLFLELLTIWPLVALAFVFGVLDAFFWPASSSVLPLLINKQHLTKANSILNMTRQASLILGPMLAALILSFGGYATVFLVTAILLLLAGVADILIKKRMDDEGTIAGNENDKINIFQSLKEGYIYVKQTPFLLALMASAVFLNLFFGGPLILGLPLFTKEVLNGTELTYSLLNGTLAAGMLVATMIIGVMNISKKRGLISVLAMLALAVAFILLSISKVLWVSLIFILLMGMASALANVPLVSAIQHHVDKKYLGRVMSFVTFAAMGLQPLSYLLTSLFLAIHIPVQMIMLASASMLCVVTFIITIKAQALREID